MVATILSFVAWNVRSSFKEALYKTYPEHGEQRKPGQKGDQQATWIEARQAWNADAALDVSVFQIILGFFGIAGVAYTVRYTRLAWLEAEKSALVAHKSLELNRDATQQSLRPYMFAHSYEYGWIYLPNDRDTIVEWQLRVVWKNTGQTTAHRVRLAAFMYAASPSLPPNFDFEERPAPDAYVGAIGPGQSFMAYVPIPVEALSAAHAGNVEVHYWSWCDYDDGFAGTPRHRTEKHAMFIPTGDPTSKDCRFRELIKTGFNGADDDCHRRPEPYNM